MTVGGIGVYFNPPRVPPYKTYLKMSLDLIIQKEKEVVY